MRQGKTQDARISPRNSSVALAMDLPLSFQINFHFGPYSVKKPPLNFEAKIIPYANLATWREQFRGRKRLVVTNGCFDLLHKGHVTYLTQAADLGNRLIVGLNTDASVKRQGKDANRPVNDEQARATVLAALSVVDLVVLFDQDTPQELIELLQPNVVAKGADYDPEETNPQAKTYIVGKDIMDRIGGEVAAIPLVEG